MDDIVKNLAVNDKEVLQKDIDTLYDKVSVHVTNARNNVVRSINTEMVKAYWLIGRDIVLHEQQGEKRADYGKNIIQEVSSRLQKEYGKGFGIRTLFDARRFYLNYQEVGKVHTVSAESNCPAFNNRLSWTHYRNLMLIAKDEARQFYEEQAIKNYWSVREMQRQIISLLFERVQKSNDQEKLLSSVDNKKIIDSDCIVKDPTVLEFLNLPESNKLIESKLEQALIGNLQTFLLEMGKDFAFVARQKRITIDGDHFYVDLVLYHMKLKCFVLIDLKTKKLTPGDLGQIRLYVNYYDKALKYKDDNPTIGIVLCADKSDAVVKYWLGEDSNQIFARKYQFDLPTIKELEKELKREIEEFESMHIEEEVKNSR